MFLLMFPWNHTNMNNLNTTILRFIFIFLRNDKQSFLNCGCVAVLCSSNSCYNQICTWAEWCEHNRHTKKSDHHGNHSLNSGGCCSHERAPSITWATRWRQPSFWCEQDGCQVVYVLLSVAGDHASYEERFTYCTSVCTRAKMYCKINVGMELPMQ